MLTRRRVVIALGAGAFAPFAAFAQQQAKIPRIGVLGPTTAAGIVSRLEAFRAGLSDLGYVEGKTIFIDYRWAEGDYGRLVGLAAELAQLNVNVIVTAGTPGCRAAKQATTTIPIVMAAIGDAVANGIVTSLARPDGNITGSTFFQPEILAKRLEMIKETVPRIARVGYIMNLDNPAATGPTLRAMQSAAKALMIELQPFGVRGPGDFSNTFGAIAKKHVDAVVTNEDSMINAHLKVIADLAAEQRLLSIGGIEFAEAGGLIGYGVNLPDLFRRAAYFVDKILRGAKLADLPIEQPTKFELVVNMKTAKALGIKIPNSILVQATKVIE